MRGLLNGGIEILGYDKDPENPGRYVVNEEEAAQVRQIFDLYLKFGSLYATTGHLNKTAIAPKKSTKRKGVWTNQSVYGLLRNMAYIGLREVNKKNKSEDQESLKPWQRYQVVKAAWPSIVSQEVFGMVQSGLQEAWSRDRERRANQENRVFLLSGILRCKECGKALVGETAHGKRQAHRYYNHKRVPGKDLACEITRLRADELEQAVVNHLDEVLFRSGHFNKVEENIRSSLAVNLKDLSYRKEGAEKRLSKLEKEIDGLIKFHRDLADSSAGAEVIQEKLEVLANQKKTLGFERESILAEIERDRDSRNARSVLEDRAMAFRKGWRKASPSLRKKLLRRVIQALHFTSDCLEVHYIVDTDSSPNPTPKNKKASENTSGANSKTHLRLKSPASKDTGSFSVINSSSLVFGGA